MKKIDKLATVDKIGNDMFWELYFLEWDGKTYDFIKVKWYGYNDDNWWENVAPYHSIATGSNGKRYKIDFRTNEVYELEDNNDR